MPYKVPVGNSFIICDTMEEALALAGKVGGAKVAAGASHDDTGGNSRLTKERFSELMKLAQGAQRKFIDAIVQNPGGRTDKQLFAALGMADGKKLGGVMAGLQKNARKAGIGVDELYSKTKIEINGELVNEYKANSALISAYKKYSEG